jgi:hypothetical protein
MLQLAMVSFDFPKNLGIRSSTYSVQIESLAVSGEEDVIATLLLFIYQNCLKMMNKKHDWPGVVQSIESAVRADRSKVAFMHQGKPVCLSWSRAA